MIDQSNRAGMISKPLIIIIFYCVYCIQICLVLSNNNITHLLYNLRKIQYHKNQAPLIRLFQSNVKSYLN